MRIVTLILVSLFVYDDLSPCGPEYFLYDYYYSVFDQQVISEKKYYPFLRNDNPYHSMVETQVSQNRKEWYALLPSLSTEKVDQLMAEGTDSELGRSLGSGVEKDESAAFDYLRFAFEAISELASGKRRSWAYDELKKEKMRPDLTALIEKANKGFKSKVPESIRIRYAYQIVRALHYSGREVEAIRFFEKKVESKFPMDELYYYTLDQVGGCYYNLEQWDKAAQAYLRVFDGSEDRKESAHLSFSWTRRHIQSFDELLTDDVLRRAYFTLKGYGSFDDPMPAMRELMTIDGSEEAIELLYVRAIRNMEQEILRKSADYLDPQGEGIPVFQEKIAFRSSMIGSYGTRLDEMLSVTEEMSQSASSERRDFWKLGESYLYFFKSDLIKAKHLLSQVTDLQYKDQKERLDPMYTVFSYTSMSEEEELEMAQILNDSLVPPKWMYGSRPADDAVWLMMSHASGLYLAQGDQAKAYLLNRNGQQLAAFGDVELIEDLISFVKQSKKNRMERLLASRLGVVDDRVSEVTDFLYHCLGKQHLQYADEKRALEAFAQINAPVNGNIDNNVITEVPAQIFSNNTKECFECPMDSVMDDEVYKAEIFSFITPLMDFEQLASAIIELKKMIQDKAEWKAKLAHYLLGNYYYNVENNGWFRGSLSDHDHCCGYNFFGTTTYFFSFAERSIDHYTKAISLSTDREFNARAYFMIAKCHQNIEYNIDGYDAPQYDPYGYSFNDGYFTMVDSLMSLEETDFVQMALKECRHFKYFSTE